MYSLLYVHPQSAGYSTLTVCRKSSCHKVRICHCVTRSVHVIVSQGQYMSLCHKVRICHCVTRSIHVIVSQVQYMSLGLTVVWLFSILVASCYNSQKSHESCVDGLPRPCTTIHKYLNTSNKNKVTARRNIDLKIRIGCT